jgi:hypothetical protein
MVLGEALSMVGAVTALGAIESTVPHCMRTRDPGELGARQGRADDSCLQYSKPVSRKVAVPIAFGGVGAVLLGGLLVVTAVRSDLPRLSPPDPVVPPQRLTPLEPTDAVGMALAQLVVEGIDGDGKPSKLLDVDDTDITLSGQGTRAELGNLRVQTAADGSWRALSACYEYESEWRLVALGTGPACAR